METAVRQMDACRAEYDQLEHRPDAVQDPGVMCLCYSAWSLWQLGFPDQALQRVLAVVAQAEQLKHKFSIGEAYGFRACWFSTSEGESHAALQSAERAIEICEECGFVVWLAHARLMRGRVVAELGDTAAGIEEMRQAYELWSATGAVVTTPFYLALRAEGFALGGRPDEGLALLDDASGDRQSMRRALLRSRKPPPVRTTDPAKRCQRGDSIAAPRPSHGCAKRSIARNRASSNRWPCAARSLWQICGTRKADMRKRSKSWNPPINRSAKAQARVTSSEHASYWPLYGRRRSFTSQGRAVHFRH